MIKAIITDIEGTTSSLSFVKDVLFPYARQHLADFVRQHQHDAGICALLNDARQLSDPQADIEQLIEQFIDWLDNDQKITPLKSLQGLIWEDGYQQAAFTGHIYKDAVVCLQDWKAQGHDLYVYSSGSVHAQKLLFAHTEYGDLTPLFSGYFDTHIGGKKETASYQAIIKQIGQPADAIVFLSDIKEELDAARIAGMHTYWLTREPSPDTQAIHPRVASFSDIEL
jgi:enolase-phosphatase E1